MSRALNYIGIAKKAAFVETGEESSRLSIRKGRARLLIVASDASPGAKKRAEGFVFESKTPLAVIPFTKNEISDMTGRPGCSMAAITDAGIASSFAFALLQEYGEDYRQLADTMRSVLEGENSKRGRSHAKRGSVSGKRRKNS